MSLKVFFKFVSISFQKQITYRFDYFVGIVNGFLYVFIFTSLWKALYAQSEVKEHSGFTVTSIVTYAVVAMAVKIAFTMDDSIIHKKVEDGSIATELIRPTSFMFMNLAENIGHSFFHFLARTVPIIIISIFIYDLSIPFEPLRLIAFLFSALLGYLLLSMLHFTVGLLAFWFVEIFPFMLFKYSLFTFFAGGIVPIDFFPERLKPLIHLLPFKHILYSPTIILIGRVSHTEIHTILIAQGLWLIVMVGVGKLMWNAGKNKLIIQGG
ncbi:MAG: hypothetical protein GY941_13400 [Planctomycetes bacterium]|nr:hypothetical protein [Planctomycetota bacterium]